jgi:hypothetical protein
MLRLLPPRRTSCNTRSSAGVIGASSQAGGAGVGAGDRGERVTIRAGDLLRAFPAPVNGLVRCWVPFAASHLAVAGRRCLHLNRLGGLRLGHPDPWPAGGEQAGREAP